MVCEIRSNFSRCCLQLAVGALAVLVCSCRTDESANRRNPGEERPEDLPSLAELRAPRVSAESGGAMQMVRRENLLSATIYRLEIPAEVDVTAAWELASTRSLPKQTVALWEANGLRVGVLPGASMVKLGQALPEKPFTRVNRLLTTGYLQPLTITPRTSQPLTLAITTRIDQPRSMVIEPAQHQFLIRLAQGPTGYQVELVPHIHVPKMTLEPRKPHEKALDGWILSELTMRATLGSGQLLMVGLLTDPIPLSDDKLVFSESEGKVIARRLGDEREKEENRVALEAALKDEKTPPPTENQTPTGEGGLRPLFATNVEDQEVTPLPPRERTGEPLFPDRLGSPLLGAFRFNRPHHTLLLIRVEE